MFTKSLVWSLLTIAFLAALPGSARGQEKPAPASAAVPAPTSVPVMDGFQVNPAWTKVDSVSWAQGAPDLQATDGGTGAILLARNVQPGTPQLRSRAYLGDAVVRLEYMAAPGTEAGIYLNGRYRIELIGETAGAMAPSAKSEGESSPGVPPLTDASALPGVWHTLDVSMRMLRVDEGGNKTQNALVLEASIDGKIVQKNTLQPTWSRGSEFTWNEATSCLTIAVDRGSFAIRQFSDRRADFSAIRLPSVSGQPTNAARLVDLVKQGEEHFRAFGCIECHAVQRNDSSTKAGPNLFGLLMLEPRDRVVVSGENHRFTIKADRAYLHRSLRTPPDELAVAESGPNEGKPYLPLMPPFFPAVVSDSQIDAIGAYLATLNEPANQGPVVCLANASERRNEDPMTDRFQMLVDRTVRIQRGPMERVSARSIHVGQPNGLNYSFDPRVLAVVQVWQGGFLDLSGELQNRGGRGFKLGYESKQIDLGTAGALLAPLNAQGKPIDFSFKDAIFHDGPTIKESLYSLRDHLDRVAEINAQFLGYSRDSKDPGASPVFNYRVGENVLHVRTDIAADGQVKLTLQGELKQPQFFTVNQAALAGLTVSTGELDAGRWTLPAGPHISAVAQGRLVVAGNPWHPKPSAFDYRTQPLVTEPSTKSRLPSGYRAENYLSPKDNYGREQLFEALGMAVAPDGTIVVATRTSGIWRLIKGEWHLFAEGLFDSLGVQVEDEHGLKLVVGQKAELTRIADTNGDGLADTFETMTDAFSYHGNYHSYMHGPVRAPNGDYFIGLNLDDAGQSDFEYKANGKYMGTTGGFRGWLVRVPAAGGFEPWANGLRSPAGLGFAPDGRFWYAENQGEYVGTSKLFVLKKGAFYGHPAGLVDLPGMTPTSPEIAWEAVSQKREAAVILLPESRLANSPGNPAWDTTEGKFGPFSGQMVIGDQTQSLLMRVTTETVNGIEQGAAMPFLTNLESGVMRPVFLPDSSLLLGETGRGWQAKGGHVSSLEHVIWDGKTTPPILHHVSAVAGGFEFFFTSPIPASFSPAELAGVVKASSWVYRDAADYGSPELDDHDETISNVEVGTDQRSLRITLANTKQPQLHPQQTARVYHLIVDGKKIWNEDGPGFDAFYTLYQFPVESTPK